MSLIAQAISQARAAAGMPDSVELDKYNNVAELFNDCARRFADRPAYTSLGNTLTYADVDRLSAAFAAYLQNHTGLEKGDRIAIQMPNLVQYPVVLFGAMRAGLVVVNTNPLYSPRELEHQLNDAGAKAIVVLANVADTLSEVLDKTGVEHVILAELADCHSPLKRMLVNNVARYVKKMVPKYSLPGAVRFTKALKLGAGQAPTPVSVSADEIAVLQYTGGTTGVAKGAMLTHRSLMANAMQGHSLIAGFGLRQGEETFIGPLPLYHIYSFFLSLLVMMDGNHTVLIPNPRDIDGLVGEMKKWQINGFSGLNTLFVALCRHPEFKNVDFSQLKVTLSGGMALTHDAAETWTELTGCEVSEGYGLTETSPVVSINPPNGSKLGTIGLAVPGTEICLMDDDGNEVTELNTRGELCVRGPQVMKGYWQRPEATAEIINEQGFLATGDIAIVREDGYMQIVDRKKNMILVSGFNVYPNEIEDVVASHPDVVECAAIGVPDDKSGEAVKIFVVGNVAEAELREYCNERLTGYKRPRYVEYRDDLPKTNVGKILHRELRDEEMKARGQA